MTTSDSNPTLREPGQNPTPGCFEAVLDEIIHRPDARPRWGIHE